MLDARCSMLDARCSMLDARCSMLDAKILSCSSNASLISAGCSSHKRIDPSDIGEQKRHRPRRKNRLGSHQRSIPHRPVTPFKSAVSTVR
jgi:hypothetical protein